MENESFHKMIIKRKEIEKKAQSHQRQENQNTLNHAKGTFRSTCHFSLVDSSRFVPVPDQRANEWYKIRRAQQYSRNGDLKRIFQSLSDLLSIFTRGGCIVLRVVWIVFAG